MTSVSAALDSVARLYVDTVAFIYFIEEHPGYIERVSEVFQRIDRGDLEAFTSVITLTEVLTQPMRKGDRALQQAYERYLLHSRHVTMLTVDADAATRAAALRARYALRTPDALQIAIAVQSGCEALLTNDTRLQQVTDLRILVLDDLTLSQV